MSTVPIFAPDGTVRDVPQAQAQESLRQGGVLGVSMMSPDGQEHTVPLNKVGEARSQGGVLSGSRATSGTPQPNMQPQNSTLQSIYSGLNNGGQQFSQATQVVPGNSLVGGLKNVAGGALQSTAGAIGNAITHPLDTAATMLDPNRMRDAMVSDYSDAYQRGGKSGLIEHILGQVGGGVLLGKTGQGVFNGATPPYESPVISPEEIQATNLARAIKPANAATYSNTIKNLTNQAGNILDYAQRTGNPLQQPLEFARAAKGAGEEALQHYQQNILGPSAGDVVSVRDVPYQGVKVPGSGSNATLANINSRIGAINDLLRPAYGKADSGATLTALEKSGLQSEVGPLTDLLHNELADRTGLAPEDIAGVRQRAAQLFDIGNATENAVRARQLRTAGLDEFGKPIPTTAIGILQKAYDSVRGGPEAIAERNFRSAKKDLNISSKPLP